jgi:redox-sensitive bicupin YhaK (pirin superfamily)
MMTEIRMVSKIFSARPTLEGAGVRLKRVFGFTEVPAFDPFLMLDDFGSSDPADYLRGFPWHPHRGIETITYMLHGRVEHGDSLGNTGVIGTGDVQWMTAGSGIIHQEMPRVAGVAAPTMGGAPSDAADRAPGTASTAAPVDAAGAAPGAVPATLLRGFQLWSNLPADHKMMDPRYQDVESDEIPVVEAAGGAIVRVICGEVDGAAGPVQDIMTDPEYLDVTLPVGSWFERAAPRGRTVFAYVFEGSGSFGPRGAAQVGRETAALFGDGDEVRATAGQETVRFLLVSGRSLGEPIAWRGPIVMNTDEELRRAFQEYQDGTFVKVGSVPSGSR